MNLKSTDIDWLNKTGLTSEDFNRQYQMIINGTSKIKLVASATVGNGITKFTDAQIDEYSRFFKQPNVNLEIVKFVPASGAATRMFKDLVNFWQDETPSPSVDTFFQNLKKFPFYDSLKLLAEENRISLQDDKKQVLYLLFDTNHMNYLNKPKGMIPFHLNEGSVTTAFEEHYLETLDLLSDQHNVRLHFTVGLAHRDDIRDLLKNRDDQSGNPGVSMKYSLQSERTNTVALDDHNQVVRDAEENILFRPGGHGSLIHNLNNIHADIIFIRNIDNVLPQFRRDSNADYRSAMAGMLLQLKQKRDAILVALDNREADAEERALTMINYELKHSSRDLKEGENLRNYLYTQLDRPIRVCGMVKNEGEPGGGPYFVEFDENTSLQIVEMSQIDTQTTDQQVIIEQSTHFNPVDIVCSTRDYKCQKYDLKQYVNPSASFVAHKSYNGKSIKALEWPGLWNGAMHHWITLFVEIPLNEFNPVKTINDLLRPNHQPKTM